MTRADAELFLRELFASAPISDFIINTALDAARIVDSEGRPPSAPDYVETVDQWWAAAEVAAMLAFGQAQAGSVNKFSSEGSSFEVSGPNWSALADRYRSRSPLSGPAGMAVIEIDTGHEFVPRSAREDWPC